MDYTIPRLSVESREIGLFVVIAVILGWIGGNPTFVYEIVFDQSPTVVGMAVLLPIFALSPIIAAAILVHRLQLTGGLRTFLRKRFRWRTNGRWYLVAIGLMPALAGVTYLGYTAFVGSFTIDLEIVGLILIEVLAVGILFNLVENYGWRGFLQEALQSHVSAFMAALGVGIVWALWHAALFLPGGQFETFPLVAFMLVVLGESVIIGWVYNSTGGSVLHAAIMHTSFNASFGVLITSMVIAEIAVDTFYAATAIVIWLTVAVIVYRTDLSTLRKEQA